MLNFKSIFNTTTRKYNNWMQQLHETITTKNNIKIKKIFNRIQLFVIYYKKFHNFFSLIIFDFDILS